MPSCSRGNAFRLGFVLAILLAGCTGVARPPAANDAADAAPASGPKRMVIGLRAEPIALHPALASPTGGNLDNLLHPGLVTADQAGMLRPILVDAVPTVENGLWVAFPDGRMETTFRIRDGVTWHDGQPFIADDLGFGARVAKDRELPVRPNQSLSLVEKVEAVDPRAARVTWAKPFIDADQMFSAFAAPLPRHLLEEPYQANKPAFTEHRYWTDEFVGLGPFRLSQWEHGSHLLLAAHPAYVLGRPKLTEVEARFILDSTVMLSNLLAGAIDYTTTNVGLDEALLMRDQWKAGKADITVDGWVVAYAQMLSPTPAAVANAQFRRALLMALDRQQMADNLMYGLAEVAHSVFSPGKAEHQETASGIVRYEYEPRRATQMLEELGYAKRADGMFRDAAGGPLQMELRAYAQRDIHIKTMLVVADYWQRLGVGIEASALPAQRATNLEEQATFPSFLVLRQPNGFSRIVTLHSAQARLPENGFNGNNNGRYMSPELDGLIERFQSTIPRAERMAVATQIVRHQTEQLPLLPLVYDATAVLTANHLVHVADGSGTHEWDVVR